MRFSTVSLLAGLVSFAAAQSTTSSAAVTTVTIPPYVPNGLQNSGASIESTLPTECIAGCAEVSPIYYYCFINNTLPNGQQNNILQCLGFLCQQTNYDLLSACLNCVVANGNERPFGYYTNSSRTAAPTGGGIIPANPNGLLNSTQANGWLQNVTDRCAAANITVTGATTVTATPTTTGPYYTSWTSGATVSLSVWTGLTTFTSALDVAYESRTVNYTLPPGVTGYDTGTINSTPALSSTGSASGSGGSTSAASASASTSKSAGFRRTDVPAWARLLAMLF